jgi:hypothetical protein
VKSFLDYFRCPQQFAPFAVPVVSTGSAGYFRFGMDTICFGRTSAAPCSQELSRELEDISSDIRLDGSVCTLPFDPGEVVDNLRQERYVNGHHKSVSAPGILNYGRRAYSYVRPFLPVPLRRQLQRVHIRNWKDIRFPAWPVDRTVDRLFEKLLALSLNTMKVPGIPFIWFWPEGYSSCAIMTHDVETAEGRDFCSQLMALDDRRNIKSAFQIVPEERYEVSPALLREFRDRGFEVNVHDLNHDGNLFNERQQFLSRVARINEYGHRFGALGFRSGVLYRNPDWYEAFEFSYDMSIPNVAHLEAQRGGCCTVMPFFIGKMLELPVTTAQDYALFHLLRDYSLDLWMRQIRVITEGYGLVSCIAHPDYIIEKRARHCYESLLDFLANLRSEGNLWLTLPREVDRWWRERAAMRLVRHGDSWQIEGAGKERARIAWASLDGDRLVYSFGPDSAPAAGAGAQKAASSVANACRPLPVSIPK